MSVFQLIMTDLNNNNPPAQQPPPPSTSNASGGTHQAPPNAQPIVQPAPQPAAGGDNPPPPPGGHPPPIHNLPSPPPDIDALRAQNLLLRAQLAANNASASLVADSGVIAVADAAAEAKKAAPVPEIIPGHIASSLELCECISFLSTYHITLYHCHCHCYPHCHCSVEGILAALYYSHCTTGHTGLSHCYCHPAFFGMITVNRCILTVTVHSHQCFSSGSFQEAGLCSVYSIYQGCSHEDVRGWGHDL